MSYPVLNVPHFPVTLISQKQPVMCRPFVVGEEKILLMALESNKDTDILNAVHQIISACTFSKLNPLTLPSFDLEYLLLQLRAKSVNNIVEIYYTCPHVIADVKCSQTIPVSIDLDTIKVIVPEGHTNKIWLTDEWGVTLRYPTSELYKDLIDMKDDAALQIILKYCMETVFSVDGKVVECREQSEKDTIAFLERLTIQQTESLTAFFNTMPFLEHRFELKCPKCDYRKDIILRGIQDFFD